MANTKPSIFIAIPARGGEVRIECAFALTEIVRTLERAGIKSIVRFLDWGIPEKVRNTFAARFLASPDFTHLLFMDNDIAPTTPKPIIRMINSNKPVIGCVCPKRSFDIARAFTLVRQGHNDAAALAGAAEFAVSGFGMTTPDEHGCYEVDFVGTGLMLINRLVFEKLAPTVRQDKSVTPTEFGYFDSVTSNDGKRSGEDVAFCRRWRESGGTISAIVDEAIFHMIAFGHTGVLSLQPTLP